MGVLYDLAGTVDTLFKFGLNGLNLRTVSSRLECRNAANTGVGDFVAGSVTGYRPQITVTTSKAIALADCNTRQQITSATPAVITIPKDATVNAAIGTEIEFTRSGTGLVTFSQEDATVNLRIFGSTAVTGHILASRYTSCVFIKVAANEWEGYGTFGALLIVADTILLAYQLAAGVDSGSASAGWNTYPLNTELLDTGNHCTLSTNQFTLLTGTYEFFDTYFRGYGGGGGFNVSLRNVTDSVDVSGLACRGGFSVAPNGEHAGSISGRFTISASKTFEARAWFPAARSTLAYGVNAMANGGSGMTFAEVYGTVGLRRLY